MNENEKIEITDSLLMGHINNELDSNVNKVVADWIGASSPNNERYNRLLKTWQVAGKIAPRPVVVDTNSAWGNVLGQIDNESGKVIPIQRNFKRRVYLSAVASVLVLFGVFSWLKYSSGYELEYTTVVSQNSGFIDELSDGSIVTFNNNTSLVYPLEFADNERRVTLNGEAFFDIERNEEKPFIINLPQDAYVKVLGTSFNIKAVDGDSLTEVYVSSGKVEFGSGADTLILTAGQKGIYNHVTGEVRLDSSPTAGIEEMFWKDGKVRFDDVPLDEVIAIMNSIVGDSLILNCPVIQNEPITSSYSKNNPLEDFLSSLPNFVDFKVVTAENGKYRIDCNED